MLAQFGSAEGVFRAEEAELRQMRMPDRLRAALLDKSLTRVEQILKDCSRLGIHVMCYDEEDFPLQFREIANPPAVLYRKGELPDCETSLFLAMVGTRTPSLYGKASAREFAQNLASCGVTVVSGIAQGIDAESLKSAIEAGGRVVSIVGNGLDVMYPVEHRGLYRHLPSYGAMLSEYPPGTRANGLHFPLRNRLIAALAEGVFVVEGPQRSGTRITARLALEQNKDVFALPGNWDQENSETPNMLIRTGEAKLVTDVSHILEEYSDRYPNIAKRGLATSSVSGAESGHGKKATKVAKSAETAGEATLQRTKLKLPKAAPQELPEEAAERVSQDLPERSREELALSTLGAAILVALTEGERNMDELTAALSESSQAISQEMTMLQIEGYVLNSEGGRFAATVRVREDEAPEG